MGQNNKAPVAWTTFRQMQLSTAKHMLGKRGARAARRKERQGGTRAEGHVGRGGHGGVGMMLCSRFGGSGA